MATADAAQDDIRRERAAPDEERLHMALDAARMAIWEWDVVADRLVVSQSGWINESFPPGYQVTRLEEGLSLIHPDDAPRYRRELEAAVKRKADFTTEFRAIRPVDGKVICVAQTAKCYEDQQHGLRLVGVVRDVTDQKQAEAALRASESRLAAIFSQAAAGFAEISLDGRFQRVNDELCRMLGRSRESILACSDADITHPDDLSRCAEGWARLLETGRPVSTDRRYLRGDGSAIWTSSIVSRLDDAQGRPMAVLAVTVDITQRLQSLEAVRQSEAVFRTLGETVPALLWMTDADGGPVYQNPAWRTYTGLTNDDVAQQGWTSIPHPDDLPWVTELWQQSLRSGEPFGLVFRCRRHDGEYRWFLGSSRPVKDATGAVLRWVGAAIDIDDQKRVHESLREADRRKDEFLATLAHELRNSLAPLRNSLDALLLAGRADASTQQLYGAMTRQLHNLGRLVDDLLEVSRITSGNIELRHERLNVAEVVQLAVEMSRPKIDAAGHRLDLSLPPEAITVVADPVRLAQVVSNLLNNSARYTPHGGQVWLSVRAERGLAAIAVRDNGIGIAPEMLPRVFDMFLQSDRDHRSAHEGLGIGLAIVRRLTERQGGRVDVVSAGIGKGCEFTVRLPLAEEPASRSLEPPSATADAAVELPVKQPGKRRILVVDDNEDAAASIEAVLKYLGCDVQAVHNGVAALEAADRSPPDIVLLDLGMPDLSGYDVAEQFRARPQLQHAKLVALTGWGQIEDRQRTAKAGFDHHLVKPVDVMTLKKLLAAD
ncbi:MAG: PAS domain S-box protein [Pirellulales bacterium]|nr:PAS domain S-box protein [Pirellulales bacterium]